MLSFFAATAYAAKAIRVALRIPTSSGTLGAWTPLDVICAFGGAWAAVPISFVRVADDPPKGPG